jgi:hypothetical protein
MGRNIFWGTIGEMAYSYTLGLLEGGFGPEPRGTPKPVYHTLKLFNEKVGNADAVTDLNPLPEGTDPTNWTWMTKFRKNDQDILVLWVEGGGQPTVDLTPHFPTSTVKITQIVTALDDNNRPIYPEPIEVPTNAVPVDNTPVFIEIPSTVTDPVCECELVPEEYVIPRGSSSTFEAILTNNSAQAQELYFATKVGVPRADQFVLYPQIGYLRGPYRVTLNPNESKSSDLGLSVPNSALPAIYKYIGYIGTPEAGFYDICHFDFQVPIEETDITWPQTDSPW